MPFKSEKQRRFLFIHHPEIAHRWSAKYGNKTEAVKKLAEKRRKK